MVDALDALGVSVTVDPTDCVAEITGCGGFLPSDRARIFCGNSGTTMRFCAALSALGSGQYELDGVARMHERPIGQLTTVLQTLGAGVEFVAEDGFPPLTIHARGLRGGHVSIHDPVSSQFITALLLASPYAKRDVMLDVTGSIPSIPYIKMTTAIMDQFGVAVVEQEQPHNLKFIIEAPQRYTGCKFAIEPDASNASYFLACAAIVGGSVTVEGIGTDSIQGDAAFVDVLEAMGCQVDRASAQLSVRGPAGGGRLQGIDVDLNAMPDMVPTLAAVALFADGETVIRNVATLREKETDRLAALNIELTKLGASVEERRDGLTIRPPVRIKSTAIDTYDDHRMAMSFAIVGLGAPGIVINEPQCCQKTFPGFFEHLEQLSLASS